MPVYKTSKGWKVENVPGYHKTKEKAMEQLRAVKASQNKRKKK